MTAKELLAEISLADDWRKTFLEEWTRSSGPYPAWPKFNNRIHDLFANMRIYLEREAAKDAPCEHEPLFWDTTLKRWICGQCGAVAPKLDGKPIEAEAHDEAVRYALQDEAERKEERAFQRKMTLGIMASNFWIRAALLEVDFTDKQAVEYAMETMREVERAEKE